MLRESVIVTTMQVFYDTLDSVVCYINSFVAIASLVFQHRVHSLW